MTSNPVPDPAGIDGVLFDFHSTLVDQGDAEAWLHLAWRVAGRDGDARAALGQARFAQLTRWLDRIWEGARLIDPDSRRDLGPIVHREVYDTLSETVAGLDRALAAAVYDTMLSMWSPYDDTVPTLRALQDAGIRTALVSNIGIDVRPVLSRTGLAGLLNDVVLSYEVGLVKPDVEIFSRALGRIGVPPERALMVGDSWRDDGGAAQLGVRTLILPRTVGSVHGLEQVLRIIGLKVGPRDGRPENPPADRPAETSAHGSVAASAGQLRSTEPR